MLCQRHHLGDDADADDDGEDSESVMMGLTQINSGSTIRSDTFESSCAFEEEVHKPIHEVNLLIQQLKSNTYMSRSTHGHLHHLSTELTRLLSSTRTKMSNPNNVEQCKYCGDSCLGPAPAQCALSVVQKIRILPISALPVTHQLVRRQILSRVDSASKRCA